MDYSHVAVMPFGDQTVGGQNIDFDLIYDNLFVPAIRATRLPDGRTLGPKRADKDIFAGEALPDGIGLLKDAEEQLPG